MTSNAVRRLAAAALALVAWAVLGLNHGPSRAQQAPARTLARGVAGVGITVSDMGRAVDFYSKVLFFEQVSDAEVAGDDFERLQGVAGARARVVTMQLGDERLELTEYRTPHGRPVPADSRSNDRWFQHIAIIVNDMDQAYSWLRRHRVQHVSPGPQRLPDWNPNAAGIRAFYFRDPDGHALEVLQFPPDKGSPRWQRPSDRVFLGIDHTAIVVGDTDASLRFYRDTLGMAVVGGSENHGPEQERLNNVAGARLRITTLRAAAGPAIELLEYLAPRDGRPFAADARANDLVHWHTIVATSSPEAAYGALLAGRHALVSPRVVALPNGLLGFREAFLARDPDGHALQFR
jgi:catechol 2,3-dioxygenase-like lactoylglutathione lyase family enzyme